MSREYVARRLREIAAEKAAAKPMRQHWVTRMATQEKARERPKREAALRETKEMFEFYGQRVYVIEAAGVYVKIGVTNNVEARMKSLRTANPHLGDVLYQTQKLVNATKVESAAHRRLARYHVSGEWFKCEGVMAVHIVKQLEEEMGQTQHFLDDPC